MAGIESDVGTSHLGPVNAQPLVRYSWPNTTTPSIDLRDPDRTRPGRVTANGIFLVRQDEPFFVKGVTYGSFSPRGDGACYPETSRLRADFAQISSLGLNTVRVLYTAPPADLVEAASEYGLKLIVGVDYEDWRYPNRPGRHTQRGVLDAGRRALDEALMVCAGREEVLAISVANEIPADMVRVHGIDRVSAVLGELVDQVRLADPKVLVTYTNYPTTEYLHVEGQTLATFNVFLEDRDAFRRYLRHLQVATGPLPLVVTELGLTAEVHGADRQAETIDWQLRIVDETGCAGATIFAFTDEWGVNGQAVDGWGFGITTAERAPKRAATVASEWAMSDIGEHRESWPPLTVVVSAYNEERTLEECLASLARCDYPELEVIVCDDGSTDSTLEIARRFPFRILELEHGGLSRARNAGIDAATGEFVAFLDADAACHPSWPWHLVLSFDSSRVIATGGPNLPFPNAPLVERAVALSPGAPTEVLLADDRAEHVAGCNMAFRRDALLGIDRFNPRYTSAGDDVDVCWKLLDGGGEIAFSQAAQVHHHRRASVRGYLRQQRGYGRAEKLLMSAHAHRFNRLGQARWAGFIYGGAQLFRSLLRPIVYHGLYGHAPFQPVVARPAQLALQRIGALLPLAAPIALLSGVAGALHSPWWLLLTLLAVLVVPLYGVAVAVSLRLDRREVDGVKLRALVGFLHVLQPFVRAWGRLRGPPRRRPEQQTGTWAGCRVQMLDELERNVSARRRLEAVIGGPRDSWDLEARAVLSRARITTAVAWSWEPVWRIRVGPRPTSFGVVIAAALVALAGPVMLALAILGVGSLLAAGEAWWLEATVQRMIRRMKATAAPPIHTVGNDRVGRPDGPATGR